MRIISERAKATRLKWAMDETSLQTKISWTTFRSPQTFSISDFIQQFFSPDNWTVRIRMSSFFTKPSSQRKRKRNESTIVPSQKRSKSQSKDEARTRARQKGDEESISASDSGDEDGEFFSAAEEQSGTDSAAEDETAAERRLRLAERYLQNIQDEVEETIGFDAAEIDRDLIAERLKEDVAETKGKMYRYVAGDLDWEGASRSFFTADQNGITGIAMCEPFAYTAARDGTVVKWEIPVPPSSSASQQEGESESVVKRQNTNTTLRRRPKFLKSYRFNPHRRTDPSYLGPTSPILCVAASSSGKFLATGCLDSALIIWSTTPLKPIKKFTQHRDAVLSVSFRHGTHQLFSASKDRTIKVWMLDEMTYVETLFGHQDDVVDIVGMLGERCISVGARDRTARLWKVVEETQLVFRGGGGGSIPGKKDKDQRNEREDGVQERYEEGAIDRVALIDEETFVTGSDSGSINLWSIHRKKPIFTVRLAHGLDPAPPAQDEMFADSSTTKSSGRPTPRWITALASVPYADIVLSGSWDGYVRAWKVSQDKRRIDGLGIVGEAAGASSENPANGLSEESSAKHIVKGFINDLSVFERGKRGEDGLCVAAALSKQHRLGGWRKMKAKNGAVIFEIKRKDLETKNGAIPNGNADGGRSASLKLG